MMKSSTVRRFDRTAEGYLHWWAPVLAPMSGMLIDRLSTLEPSLASDPGSVATARVVDVGCGTGNVVLAAARGWPKALVTGIDASVGMLAVADRERATLDQSIADRVSLVASDAAALPFPDGTFDVAMTAFVVQLVGDRPAVLREMRRVLRPGGLLGICGWLETGYVFAGDRELDAALADASVEQPPVTEVRAGWYESPEQAERELVASGFAAVDVLPATLNHAWTAQDYLAYRVTTRDVELVDAMTPKEKRRFLASYEQRLAALSADELVFRAAVMSITARAER